ncbi:MAG: LysM peptidoglycan-binding domain-containing protein [Treponema sp.]|nr:LysM peptidoglycan-binding domain-containing protein [Treponema sp.]
MKRFAVGIMVLLVGLLMISCPSAPPPDQPPPPPPPPVAPPPVVVGLDLTGAQTYTVVAGDTLSGIARMFYGPVANAGNAGPQNGLFFPLIMAASAPVLDPDLIFPGSVLTIPDLRRNLDSPGARQAIAENLRLTADFISGRNRVLDVQGLRSLADSL